MTNYLMTYDSGKVICQRIRRQPNPHFFKATYVGTRSSGKRKSKSPQMRPLAPLEITLDILAHKVQLVFIYICLPELAYFQNRTIHSQTIMHVRKIHWQYTGLCRIKTPSVVACWRLLPPPQCRPASPIAISCRCPPRLSWPSLGII